MGKKRARPYRQLRSDPLVDQATAAAGRSSLLPILQQVQESQGWLSPAVLGAVSDKLNRPDAQTFGVASFYSMLSVTPAARQVIRVCDGPVCSLAGCQQVRARLAELADDETAVVRTSCLGLCDRAPAALVDLEAAGPLSVERAAEVLVGYRGQPRDYAEPQVGEVRIALARLGRIDPESLDSARQVGAYTILQTVAAPTPQAVLAAVEDSGLQGRGGAGFPTGRKWRMVAEAEGQQKYIVCNADESEPASFKDRVLLEGDPHLLLEGMLLAGYAVGAQTGIIYIRGEYEQAAASVGAGDRAGPQGRLPGIESGEWILVRRASSSRSRRLHLR